MNSAIVMDSPRAMDSAIVSSPIVVVILKGRKYQSLVGRKDQLSRLQVCDLTSLNLMQLEVDLL